MVKIMSGGICNQYTCHTLVAKKMFSGSRVMHEDVCLFHQIYIEER